MKHLWKIESQAVGRQSTKGGSILGLLQFAWTGPKVERIVIKTLNIKLAIKRAEFLNKKHNKGHYRITHVEYVGVVFE